MRVTEEDVLGRATLGELADWLGAHAGMVEARAREGPHGRGAPAMDGWGVLLSSLSAVVGGGESFGRADNLVDRGVESLEVSQLAAELSGRVGVRVTEEDVLGRATLGELADWLRCEMHLSQLKVPPLVEEKKKSYRVCDLASFEASNFFVVFGGYGYPLINYVKMVLHDHKVADFALSLIDDCIDKRFIEALEHDEKRTLLELSSRFDLMVVLLFACQVASYFKLLSSSRRNVLSGLRGVTGHSAGLFAAAVAAQADNIDSLRDAATRMLPVVRCFGQKVAGLGVLTKKCLVSITGPRTDDVLEAIQSVTTEVEVCVVNSRFSCVLGGDMGHLEKMISHMRDVSMKFSHKFLDVPFPAHTSRMEPLFADIMNEIENIRMKPLKIPLISPQDGTRLHGDGSFVQKCLRSVICQHVDWPAATREAVKHAWLLFDLGPTHQLGIYGHEGVSALTGHSRAILVGSVVEFKGSKHDSANTHDGSDLRAIVARCAPLHGNRGNTMSSNQIIAATSALQAEVGTHLPATVLFDYPTVDSLLGYLQATLVPDASLSPPLDTLGGANTLGGAKDGFVKEVRAQSYRANAEKDSIRIDVHDRDRCDSTIFCSRLNHAVNSADCVFFALPSVEYALMDPQQLLLLEETSKMEELIVLSGCGVFVGLSIYASNQSFESSSRHGHGISSYTAVTNAVSVSAGRISFAYGLKGPAMCLDTACSSALVASSVAFQTDIQTSYVSCIALLLTPTASDAFHASGMLASDGRCKTMDARANGYVRSEGCYSLLLDVNHDNRVRMLCCVINQDGRSSSLTAPNGNSQSSLLRDALVLSASDSLISNFELHGTGTALGDPIEMGAIQSSVAHCQIGSFGAAKSRQGHAEACAGMRGLLNSVACSSRSICAPFTHLVTLNQYVRESLGSDALALSRMQYATLSSRVNVSSFGFSGTNAHAVLDVRGKRRDISENVAIHNILVESQLCFHDVGNSLRTHLSVPNQHFNGRISVESRAPSPMQLALCQLAEASLHTFDSCCTPSNATPLLQHGRVLAHDIISSRGLRSLVFCFDTFTNQVLAFYQRNTQRSPALMRAFDGCLERLYCTPKKKTSANLSTNIMGQHSKRGAVSSKSAWLTGTDARHHNMRFPAFVHPFLAAAEVLTSACPESLGLFLRTLNAGAKANLVRPSRSSANLRMDNLSGLVDVFGGSDDGGIVLQLQSKRKQSTALHHNASDTMFLVVWETTATREDALRSKISRPQRHWQIWMSTANAGYTATLRADGVGALASISAVLAQAANGSCEFTSLETASRDMTGWRGLVRSIGMERRALAISLSTLSQHISSAAVTRDSMVSPCSERKIACQALDRSSGISCMVHSSHLLRPATRSDEARQSFKRRFIGSFTVSGGLGSLGSVACALLSRAGAHSLLGIGRRGRSSCWPAIVGSGSMAQLSSANADLCAVEDRALTIGSLTIQSKIASHGIVHAAGTIEYFSLPRQRAHTLRSTRAPKFAGAQLCWQCKSCPISMCVLFSSVASLLGSTNLAAYAAANAALDSASNVLLWQGIVTRALHWGGWSEIGMVAGKAVSAGYGAVRTFEGLGALFDCLSTASSRPGNVAVSRFAFSWFVESAPALPQCIRGMLDAPGDNTRSAGPMHPQVDLTAPSEEKVGRILNVVRECVISSLGLDHINDQDSLLDAGIDSMSSISLINALEKKLCVPISSALVFDHPCIRAIAAYLSVLLGEASKCAPSSLKTVPEEVTQQSLSRVIRAMLSEMIGHEPDSSVAFAEMNFDSLAHTQLQRSLANEFDVLLPSTLMYDYPTIDAVASHVLDLISKQCNQVDTPKRGNGQSNGTLEYISCDGKEYYAVFGGIGFPCVADLHLAIASGEPVRLMAGDLFGSWNPSLRQRFADITDDDANDGSLLRFFCDETKVTAHVNSIEGDPALVLPIIFTLQMCSYYLAVHNCEDPKSFFGNCKAVLPHSFGIFAGAVVAGSVCPTTFRARAIEIMAVVCSAAESVLLCTSQNYKMVALTGCRKEDVILVNEQTRGTGEEEYAGVAIVNGPRAVILSGGQQCVEKTIRALKAQDMRFTATALPLPIAAHTEYLRPAAEAVLNVIEEATIALASPLISPIDGQLITENLALKWCVEVALCEAIDFQAGANTLVGLTCSNTKNAGEEKSELCTVLDFGPSHVIDDSRIGVSQLVLQSSAHLSALVLEPSRGAFIHDRSDRCHAGAVVIDKIDTLSILEKVCSVVADVLKRVTGKTIVLSQSANIFDAGIMSLNAPMIASALERACDIRLSPDILYQHPTPLEICNHICNLRSEKSANNEEHKKLVAELDALHHTPESAYTEHLTIATLARERVRQQSTRTNWKVFDWRGDLFESVGRPKVVHPVQEYLTTTALKYEQMSRYLPVVVPRTHDNQALLQRTRMGLPLRFGFISGSLTYLSAWPEMFVAKLSASLGADAKIMRFFEAWGSTSIMYALTMVDLDNLDVLVLDFLKNDVYADATPLHYTIPNYEIIIATARRCNPRLSIVFINFPCQVHSLRVLATSSSVEIEIAAIEKVNDLYGVTSLLLHRLPHEPSVWRDESHHLTRHGDEWASALVHDCFCTLLKRHDGQEDGGADLPHVSKSKKNRVPTVVLRGIDLNVDASLVLDQKTLIDTWMDIPTTEIIDALGPSLLEQRLATGWVKEHDTGYTCDEPFRLRGRAIKAGGEYSHSYTGAGCMPLFLGMANVEFEFDGSLIFEGVVRSGGSPEHLFTIRSSAIDMRQVELAPFGRHCVTIRVLGGFLFFIGLACAETD